mgnify:FL=1
MLDLESLFTDPTARREREALFARWRREGLHDDLTIGEALTRAGAADPDNGLLFHSIDSPGQISLRELDRESRSVAGALARRGIARGDVVAIQLPNRVETAVIYCALARLGAILVPIVHSYGPTETAWIVRASGAGHFVCPDRWGGVDFLERTDRMPEARAIVVGERAPPGTISWQELLEDRDPAFSPPRIAATDPLLVVYTSGTTSEPKGVVHSHQTMLAELRNMPHMPISRRGSVCLQPWPAGHIAGLCAVFGPLVTGIRVILLDKWNDEQATSLIGDHGVTSLAGTPFHITALLDRKERGDARLDSIEEITCGGAGVPPSLIERCQAAGWRAMRCYGSSEHPTATSGAAGASVVDLSTTDGAPCPHTEVRIAREDGSEAPTGEPGEVWLRGPEQFLGYTDPAKNLDAFAPGSWFRTGDIGVVDARGQLAITDRLKDIIIRGGENFSSVEIEDFVLRHENVAEVAAVGLPDPRYGERVCVFVVPAEGREAPTIDELAKLFAELGVARQKTPEKVIAVDEFPRTPAGKIKKHELRGRLAKENAARLPQE